LARLVAASAHGLEGAAVDVAQHEVRRASRVNRRDTRELPIQADGADECSAELVVVDVVDFLPAGLVVAQQQIGFARECRQLWLASPRESSRHRREPIEALFLLISE
jgi:hypothetical protein